MSTENPHAGQGMVVLDIGGDIGALVVSGPAKLAGAEIEVCPSGARDGTPDEGRGWWQGEWRSHGHAQEHSHRPAWPHVAVIARPTPQGPQFAAVFSGLRQGRYDLWVRFFTMIFVPGPTLLGTWYAKLSIVITEAATLDEVLPRGLVIGMLWAECDTGGGTLGACAP